MTPLLTIIVVVFLIGVLIPKRSKDSSSSHGASVKISYLVFIIVLASSPVIGALIGTARNGTGNSVVFLQYLWVGIAISFPLSLLIARMFGETNLSMYWKYLESLGGHSRAVITYSWSAASVVAAAGALIMVLIT